MSTRISLPQRRGIDGGMAVLSVDQASLSYGGNRALDIVSLSVASGEFVVALGPSGCGKTSLLNLMAGFVSPSPGSVRLDGKPITGPGSERAVVFQDDALYPWFTVEDNISLALRFRGVGPAERRRIARDLLSQIGLADFAAARIWELSGGMRQRVGLARALAAEPDFLLMDEPLGALDALTREVMQTTLLDIWAKSQKGVFLITHSIEEAVFLATKLVVMSPRPGRIIAEFEPGFAKRYAAGETARALKQSPEFQAMRASVADLVFAAMAG
jgi:taurine transport system ATP-binding protein